jgi:hypothetical protein
VSLTARLNAMEKRKALNNTPFYFLFSIFLSSLRSGGFSVVIWDIMSKTM